MKHLILLITAFISGFAGLSGQDSMRLAEIRISGNKRTRPEVFLREMEKVQGDRISAADSLIRVWEKRFSGLGLFNEVEVRRTADTLHIRVRERIYTWALPEFTWADRNFNVWWQTRDPQRLIYGATFYFNNLKGLNHNLAITVISGYNRSYSAQYNKPFSRHRSSWGYSAGAGYWSNHELWYKTRDDKIQFLRIEDVPVQRNYWVGGTLRRRLTYFSRWEAFLFRGGVRLADSAARADRQPVLNYVYGLKRDYYDYGVSYINDHRDQRDYPTSGYLIRAAAGHTWMNFGSKGPSVFYTELRANRFIPLRKNLVLATGLSGRYRFDHQALVAGTLPYIYGRQLGYGSDYVRGYEPYVADGSGFVLGKTALRRALLQGHRMKLGKGRFLENYRTVPLSLWFSIFADAGRVIRPVILPENSLNTRWMTGAGVGLDIVAWYSAMARLELSRNHMGTWIFNLSYNNAF